MRVLLFSAMVAAAGCDVAFHLERGLDAAQHVEFIQVAAEVPSSGKTVDVVFEQAQGQGHLNVVAVGWYDVTRVDSVSDANGSYQLAVGTMSQGPLHQAMYYRGDIAAAAPAANVVTVTFSDVTNTPDVRIVEYAGIDPARPFELGRGSTGISVDMTSGEGTTKHAHDLLVGAATVARQTVGPGEGFTGRIITVPDGDFLEDREVTTAGIYAATAIHSLPEGWVMQLAVFRGQ